MRVIPFPHDEEGGFDIQSGRSCVVEAGRSLYYVSKREGEEEEREKETHISKSSQQQTNNNKQTTTLPSLPLAETDSQR